MIILLGVSRSQKPLKATGRLHHTPISSINVVRRYQRKVVYIMTNIQTVSIIHTRKNEIKVNLRNKNNCSGIGTLK